MKPFSTYFASLLFLWFEFTAAQNEILGEPSTDGSVKLLVKYKDGVGKYSPTPVLTESESNFRKGGASLIDAIASRSESVSVQRHIARIQVLEKDVGVVIWELMADDDVVEVERDFEMYKFRNLRFSPQQDQAKSTHDAERHFRYLEEATQNGVNMIQAPDVWKSSNRSPSPIKICVVDTGYDLGHVDLPQEDSGITYTQTGFGSALRDGDGHGTHCAGVIGAVGNNKEGVIGVMPDPSKFSFHISKALDDNGIGSSSTIMEGVEGCISNGAKVISMSLGGGPKSSFASKLFQDAYDDGVLVFAASGNTGTSTKEYPASYPHVISVGAVYENEDYASFSNYNDQVELLGPGVRINSTLPGDKYGVSSGTSMATPHVAAAAALVWSYFPECSNHQLRTVLALTAKDLTSNSVGCDEKTGFGLVQAKAAYDLLDKYGCNAGGVDPTPLSSGGIGGCDQPLPKNIPGQSFPRNPAPTINPTKRPSNQPSSVPTSEPSIQPSPIPTEEPTNIPTLVPTNVTSDQPSFSPTIMPTESPTSAPAFVGNNTTEESSSSQDTGDNDDCDFFQLDILTDHKASETLWKLEQIAGQNLGILEMGPPLGQSYANETMYEGVELRCISPGDYVFTIYDTNGDGLNEPAYYQIFLNGVEIARGSDFGHHETTLFSINGTENTANPNKYDSNIWADILEEDFENGYGTFNGARGYDVVYKDVAFSRLGVVRIQDGDGRDVKSGFRSAVYSNNIPLQTDYTKFKIIFSFYAIIDIDDSFCLDYSVNDGLDWKEQKCWRGYIDFSNHVWVDDFSYEWGALDISDSLRIRLRCAADSNFDDVYIDRIKLQGLKKRSFNIFPLM